MLEIKNGDRDYTEYTPIAYAFFLLVFIVFFSAGYYIKQKFFQKDEVQNVEVVTTTQKKAPPIDDQPAPLQLKYLQSRSKDSLVTVGEGVTIKSNTVPVALLNLLGHATVSGSKSLQFERGKKGYEVIFYLPGSIDDEFLDFVKTIDTSLWNVTSASYTENAGLLKIENIKYKVSFNFIQSDGSKTRVTLSAYVK